MLTMCRVSLLLVVVFVVTAITGASENDKCVNSFKELEVSLKANPPNIESIDDGFFSPNNVLSLWVTVNIYYNTSNENHGVVPTQPYFNDIKPDVIFYWYGTALFLSFRPDIIMKLSGLNFFLEESTNYRFGITNIVIDPVCNMILLQKLVLKVWATVMFIVYLCCYVSLCSFHTFHHLELILVDIP